MPPSMFRTALVLGLLSALGPFTIDTYLPALPAIAEALGSDVTAAQATLTAYFLAFGLAQLVYGPWADARGRREPMLFGLGLYILASAGCALAPSIGWLIVMRFAQGAGAAAMMVLPRAVIRDMHTGPEATRMMATIMLVIAVSPMLAPLAGTGILAFAGWRVIFWALALVAALCVAVTLVLLPETLPPARRRRLNLGWLRQNAGILLRDPVFTGLTLVGGFGMASFFVFIASASFVYMEQFGMSEMQFSLAFAVNALGFFGASQVAGPLQARFGAVRVMRRAVLGFAGFAVLNAMIAGAGASSLPLLMVLLFCGNACLGLVMPATMVMALDPHGERAGLGASLGGTIQMLTGGLMIVAASPFFDNTAPPMLAAIAVCATMAMLIALWVLPRVDRASGPAQMPAE
ncbi:multidrug effflux MFS transporter [Pseudoroseicyclus aestuarii]|uniref:Bcr/CflA family efflux transporter n=1 Tax=Pseudoroseicyclus aestuarii TaxID=1795041 RepID=A0A318SQV7_9RHOB|nr:multidrug effflux MFS transporter [Pseudoroseicyclus aestuarii]PYE84043.1 DHA1 family bicyclomycin/chloramphenicol resistance-like MFS transporter [Pseudoroseicyclus aestuarii]